tara:strand:+ start:4750 stop:5403 length:654 start_codon:yes stop_codon:yes gene_type:complete
MKLGKLVLIRHGQSTYNLENRFTGWKDVPLTKLGEREALEAAEILKKELFDVAFTSNLYRAQKTLSIILEGIKQEDLEVIKNQALNERDYGDLIGQNKKEIADKFGKEQVKIWRRSYDIAPPNGESLKMTAERAIPYLEKEIMPKILDGGNVLVVAHGNSLRALVMKLKKYSPEQILKTEIGWCEPWIFEIDNKGAMASLNIIPRPGSKSMSKIPEF